MSEFKVGDLVYFPKKSNKVLMVDENSEGFGLYPLIAGDDGCCFTPDGKYSVLDALPSIFHATKENHELLEQLYGIEFEKPPVKPTSCEIIQAMLARGDKSVPCWVSVLVEEPSFENLSRMIHYIEHGEFTYFVDTDGEGWEFATLFDPRTGEPITELPE